MKNGVRFPRLRITDDAVDVDGLRQVHVIVGKGDVLPLIDLKDRLTGRIRTEEGAVDFSVSQHRPHVLAMDGTVRLCVDDGIDRQVHLQRIDPRLDRQTRPVEIHIIRNGQILSRTGIDVNRSVTAVESWRNVSWRSNGSRVVSAVVIVQILIEGVNDRGAVPATGRTWYGYRTGTEKS